MKKHEIRTEYKSMRYPLPLAPITVLTGYFPESNKTCHVVASLNRNYEFNYTKLCELDVKMGINHIVATAIPAMDQILYKHQRDMAILS